MRIEKLNHQTLASHIESLANLRIEVFRDFPYLYEGSFDYEKNYLQVYLKSKRCAVIAAFDGDQMVGAATALPLLDENDYVQEPFIKAGMDLSEIFYFGESVLLKEYRGKGLGHKFFDGREEAALSYPDYKITTFCAVQRPFSHPMRPSNYQPLDEFWKKRGYVKNEKIQSKFSWLDIGDEHETQKNMTYWMKEWR